MFCPTCGSEERQLIQYCRACGTDLRVIRAGLQNADTFAPAYARDHISRAIAEKIRETQSPDDLKKVAEEVLPEIEKFFESPEEKRLRRIRAGVVIASMGFGGTLIAFLLTLQDSEFMALLLPGVVLFFIGLAIILNGIFFTLPQQEIDDSDANLQVELNARAARAEFEFNAAEPKTNELEARENLSLRPSVTEHTTHRLKNQ